jgi:hypothetical protein
VTHLRPASGSCPRCRAALDLASYRDRDGAWYCCAACARGEAPAGERETLVPEAWLTATPKRFFRARKPKELRATQGGRGLPR